MKKQRIFEGAIAFAFLASFFFLIAAFVNGSLSSMQWPEGGRIFVALAWVISLLASALFASLPRIGDDY